MGPEKDTATAGSKRISASHPVAHAGSIVHAAGKGGVAGLAVSGRLLACATGECVTAWRLDDDDDGGCGDGALEGDSPGLLREAMRHELDGEKRRIVTHLALLDGLVLAAGHCKAAKRRREAKKGVVSQIDPRIFVLACEAGSLGDAGSGALPAHCMADVDLPSGMAMWESFGGLAVALTGSGDRLVLLAHADGHVVRWTLASAMDPPNQRASRRSSTVNSSAAAEGGRSCGVVIDRCSILPPATEYGALKNIVMCGQGDRYAVGALQHGIAVWDHQDRVLLHKIHVSAIGNLIKEITDIASWQHTGGLNASEPHSSACAKSLHLAVSLDALRPRANARHTRGSQVLCSQASAMSSQVSEHSSSHQEAGADENVTPACLLVKVDLDSGDMVTCRRLALFDTPAGVDSSLRGKVAASDASSAVCDAESAQGWSALAARCSSVACTSRTVAAGFRTGTVAVWSAMSARLVALLRDPRAQNNEKTGVGAVGGCGVTCVAMHPTRRLVVAGRSDGTVDVWASPGALLAAESSD